MLWLVYAMCFGMHAVHACYPKCLCVCSCAELDPCVPAYRWAVEATFIATAAPVSQAQVFMTAGAGAKLGYCGLEQDVKGFDPGGKGRNAYSIFTQV